MEIIINLRLCFAFVAFITTVSSDHRSSSSSISPENLVKLRWFSPILLNQSDVKNISVKTDLKQEHERPFDSIVWPQFQQMLYWLQPSQEKIHLNQTLPLDVPLRQAIYVGYEMKCMKATTEPYVFDNATKNLYYCLRAYLRNVNGSRSISIDGACRDQSVPAKCMETWKSKMSRCLNEDELKTFNSLQRILVKMLNLTCSNGGHDFDSIMSGEGNQCIRTQHKNIRNCVKGTEQIVFPVQEGTLQFGLNIRMRQKLNEESWCIVSALNKCSDKTATHFYDSLFSIVRDELYITVPIWTIIFIIFIICMAFSFFACVYFTSKSTKESSELS